jgi:hypothetical protein
MKNRILWFAVAAAVIAAALFLARRPATPAPTGAAGRPPPAMPARTVAPKPGSAATTLPGPAGQVRPATTPAAAAPPAAQRKPGYPAPVVPIQDGATIDFSIGTPVVRSGGADTEALERSLQEMAKATKNVTFPPAQKATAEPAPKK